MNADPTKTAVFRRWSKGARVLKEGAKLPRKGPFVVKAYHGSHEDIFSFWTTGPEARDEDDEEPRVAAGDPNTYWGAHFALEPEVAAKFAGEGGAPKWLKTRTSFQGIGTIYPVWLRLENPVRMTEEEMMALSMRQVLRGWALDVLDEVFQGYLEGDEPEEEQLDRMYEDYQRVPGEWRERVNRDLLDLAVERSDEGDAREELVQDLGSAAKQELQAQGYDSVIYQNVIEGGTSVVVFDPTQIKSIWNRGTFDLEDPDIRHNGGVTETAAFRRWFGKSQVVDERGEPLVLYHGTRADFTTVENTPVFYLTPDGSLAGDYATWKGVAGKGANVLPLYVKAERLLVFNAQDFGRYGMPIRDFERMIFATVDEGITSDAGPQTDVYDFALDAGYDGIVFKGVRDDPGAPRISPVTDVYAFFPSAQFKSATGNRGTFDPDDPDIRHNGPFAGKVYQVAEDEDSAWSEEAWRIAVSSPIRISSDKRLSQVAVRNGEVVGAGFSAINLYDHVLAYDVVITPDAHRQGAGEAIVRAIHNEFYDLEEVYPGLRIEVEVVNDGMAALLKRLGYRKEWRGNHLYMHWPDSRHNGYEGGHKPTSDGPPRV